MHYGPWPIIFSSVTGASLYFLASLVKLFGVMGQQRKYITGVEICLISTSHLLYNQIWFLLLNIFFIWCKQTFPVFRWDLGTSHFFLSRLPGSDVWIISYKIKFHFENDRKSHENDQALLWHLHSSKRMVKFLSESESWVLLKIWLLCDEFALHVQGTLKAGNEFTYLRWHSSYVCPRWYTHVHCSLLSI